MPHDDDDEYEGAAASEGLVGRLLKRGVGAPTAAIGYLGEQFNGWKSEFMTIFQTEIRRFLDRVNPSEELEKLTVGKRLEITMSVKLVDDKQAAPAGSKPKSKKKKSDGHR
jgi:hypothetical protein